MPTWISFLSSEKKLLMFPTETELGNTYLMRVRETTTANKLNSDFNIIVVNNPPEIKLDILD